VIDSSMAPTTLSWHEEYERVFHRFEAELAKLTNDPSFQGAEDLGDYIECISDLITFRPRTRDDIVSKVRSEFYPNVSEED
jgi:hypothetical protein